MIQNFQNIGRAVLTENGFYETTDEMEKRRILLFHQSLIPKPKVDKDGNPYLNGRAICLNFDLEKEIIEFRLSDFDLEERKRNDIMAFKLAAPKDKKKFFATNNVATLYTAVIGESIQYIQDKKKNIKSASWFQENVNLDYQRFLEGILNTFYLIQDKSFQLNSDKLIEKQARIFSEIEEEFGSKKIDEKFNRFLNKLFFNTNTKNMTNFPSVFLLTFNGKTIFELENGRYSDSYLNICYYDLLMRFSVEKGKAKKYCYCCNKEHTVVQDIPLPMKFYGTTNSLNFEKVSRSNAYKSFAVCQDCLPEILTGMKVIELNLNDYLFGLQLFIIPHTISQASKDFSLYKKVIKLFRVQKSEYRNEILQLKKILRDSYRKNILFDLLFYFHPAGSQQFDILKLISNIELETLLTKLKDFDSMSEVYKLPLLTDKYGNKSLTLNDLRNYLFPSMASQSKSPDYNVYGKNLLNFFEGFVTNKQLSYTDLLHKFITIYRKRLHRDRVDPLAAFKMVLALTVFDKQNQLRKGGTMDSGNFVSEVSNEKYREFFVVHKAIYGNNAYRQGLFLLGTVIEKIKFKQKDKSSNFLKKMNMEGMPARRLNGFISQVRDFANIYKIYEEPGIWGNIMDRLQGIEASSIKPDEIVFYILTGISFADYLGMRHGMEKKLSETNGGE